MQKFFEDFFDGEKIYERGVISAESLKIIQPHLMPENIKSAIVLSNEREITHKGNITYMPIYYIMFI